MCFYGNLPGPSTSCPQERPSDQTQGPNTAWECWGPIPSCWAVTVPNPPHGFPPLWLHKLFPHLPLLLLLLLISSSSLAIYSRLSFLSPEPLDFLLVLVLPLFTCLPQTKRTSRAGTCLIHLCIPSSQDGVWPRTHPFLNERVAASLDSPYGEQGSIAHPHYSPSLVLLLMASCCHLSFLQCAFWSLPFLFVHFVHPKGIEFRRDSLNADCFRSSSISKRGKGKSISWLLFILPLIYFSKDALSGWRSDL